jgi:hypothetical protein
MPRDHSHVSVQQGLQCANHYFGEAPAHKSSLAGTIAAVVLIAEGDAGLVARDQTPIGDGDPVGIAREILQSSHGFRLLCRESDVHSLFRSQVYADNYSFGFDILPSGKVGGISHSHDG